MEILLSLKTAYDRHAPRDTDHVCSFVSFLPFLARLKGSKWAHARENDAKGERQRKSKWKNCGQDFLIYKTIRKMWSEDTYMLD